MADGTNIEWTDATWNPITGCKVVSPGCTNCYAIPRPRGRRMRERLSWSTLAALIAAGGVIFAAVIALLIVGAAQLWGMR